MGVTDVAFRGREFSTRDPIMEFLLKLLVDEIDELGEPPAWLAEAREMWFIKATIPMGHGQDPALDTYLTDRTRCDLVLGLARRALARLESFGDPIPVDTLNAVGAGQPDSPFPIDLAADVFLVPARQFIDLIEQADDLPAGPAHKE